jgi:hypothetical protein
VASVRENAAYSLGRLRAKPAAPSLGRLVEKDPSAEVREMAAWAVGNLRSAEAAAGLSSAVERDTSSEVRATAVWALAQLALANFGLMSVLRDVHRDPGRQGLSGRPRSLLAWLIEATVIPRHRGQRAARAGLIRDAGGSAPVSGGDLARRGRPGMMARCRAGGADPAISLPMPDAAEAARY